MRPFRLLALAALIAAPATGALAWGATGHRLVSTVGVQSLPPEVPAFLRTPTAVQQIGELGREPDRSKGSGQPHDADLDPGHFLNLDDSGRIAGGPSLAELPPSREAYSTVLRAVGSDPSKVGYLPYNLNGGWQQLVRDFAYWRVDVYGAAHGRTAKERAWFAADRRLHELITIRDLGYWSHFVGDASQPMHVTTHYNGWGDGPNPSGFTKERIHGPFEGAFVHENMSLAEVRAALTPPQPCAGPIQACTAAYLTATQSKVIPLYALWKEGGFRAGDARGRAFVAERLGAGASALRDLVTAAWRASADSVVGYPAVKVRDVEEGRTPAPFDNMVGLD